MLTGTPLWIGLSVNNWAVHEMSLLLLSSSFFSGNRKLEKTIGNAGSHVSERGDDRDGEDFP